MYIVHVATPEDNICSRSRINVSRGFKLSTTAVDIYLLCFHSFIHVHVHLKKFWKHPHPPKRSPPKTPFGQKTDISPQLIKITLHDTPLNYEYSSENFKVNLIHVVVCETKMKQILKYIIIWKEQIKIDKMLYGWARGGGEYSHM